MSPSLRVLVIADSRFPIREPFEGGMQSLTWHLINGLRQRGVEVTVFAGAGSDTRLLGRVLPPRPLALSAAARADISMEPAEWMAQHHAYLHLMLSLADNPGVDIVHNNSLHHLPVAMADAVPVPMVTTLHTPPTPWLESAVSLSHQSQTTFAAVSRHTARSWKHVLVPGPEVIRNGIDPALWPVGPGGPDLVWVGRIVPEKAPHLAIEIARAAGRVLRLAGPVSDRAYWKSHIEPALGGSVQYVGHLRQAALATLVGSSKVCLVTPTWDEPFGLVAAEALACGTPVLGFDSGGLPEVVSESCARLVRTGDVGEAVEQLPSVERLERSAARHHAVSACSQDRMISQYLRLYDELRLDRAA